MFYALQFPHAELGIMLGRFFSFRWIRLPAWGAFALWLVFQLIGARGQLHHIGSVNSHAHLGGCIGGFLLWLAWRRLELKKTKSLPSAAGETLVITKK